MVIYAVRIVIKKKMLLPADFKTKKKKEKKDAVTGRAAHCTRSMGRLDWAR
jgi:hypothetical protein